MLVNGADLIFKFIYVLIKKRLLILL